MKLFNYIFIAATLCVCHSSIGQSIMSFNIRYDSPHDGDNKWTYRKGEVAALIEYYHADFVGTQEGLLHQVEYIQNHTSNYAYIGAGRDDGKDKGEFTALFYDSAKFDLIASETFWLSDTPRTISVGWDAALNRTCTYGHFVNKKTMDSIWVFNTHFDHIGVEARQKSAALIVDQISSLAHAHQSIIVMGDFNCELESVPMKIFTDALDDGKAIATATFYGPVGTFNQFDPYKLPDPRIDYILTKNVRVISYRHIDDRRKNSLCVSDHLPVLMRMK